MRVMSVLHASLGSFYLLDFSVSSNDSVKRRVEGFFRAWVHNFLSIRKCHASYRN